MAQGSSEGARWPRGVSVACAVAIAVSAGVIAYQTFSLPAQPPSQGVSLIRAVPVERVPDARQPTPINLGLEVPRPSYRVGEALTFTIRSDTACDFFIYSVDAHGKLERHFPELATNIFGNSRLLAGESRVLPLTGVAEIVPPLGPTEVGIVCATGGWTGGELGPEFIPKDKASLFEKIRAAIDRLGTYSLQTASARFEVVR